jgi:hypothetical protein
MAEMPFDDVFEEVPAKLVVPWLGDVQICEDGEENGLKVGELHWSVGRSVGEASEASEVIHGL